MYRREMCKYVRRSQTNRLGLTSARLDVLDSSAPSSCWSLGGSQCKHLICYVRPDLCAPKMSLLSSLKQGLESVLPC